MVRQIPFTKYEAALLLDAFLQTLSGDILRKDAVKSCSEALRRMAVVCGLEIDDAYRSTGGISFQMASMESAYCGRTIVKPATKLFVEMVDKYKNNHREYERILNEAKLMSESKRNNKIQLIKYAKQGNDNVEAEVKLTIGRKHNRDGKDGFYQWMFNEQHMAEASCRGYLSAVRSAEKYALEHELGGTKLLGVSVDEARTTADALFSDEEFIEKNEVQHNRFRVAIAKMLAYLGEEWTVPDKIELPKKAEEIDVDIMPFCEVLTANFPRGYRLGSLLEMRKFRRHFEEINGIAMKLEAVEVETVIRECGIEHDGRIYIPQTMLSDELRDRLFAYIDKIFNEGKYVIYFEALFKEFSEQFLDHNIYDANMLKAYIAHMVGEKYYIARSYLSKEKRTSVDPIADVRTYLKEHGLPMEVDKLCQTLSHIPAERIKSILGTNGEFVRNSKGEYFHADSFAVTEEELENISLMIGAEIEVHQFISGNELHDAIKRKHPYIYERNMMFSSLGWRDALKYKLGDRYSFAGNIISSKENDLSMSDVFENFAKVQQNFTMRELQAFAKNIGSTIYFDALYRNAARVSRERFVQRDEVRFQVKETDRILDRFCTGNYISLSKIRDFGIFPEASHPWTLFLLEHYLSFHSERYYLMHGGYNIKVVVGAMVRKEIVYDSFDELLTDILVESGVVLQRKDALNYLSDNGYIARRSYTNIESFLINAQAKRNKKEK